MVDDDLNATLCWWHGWEEEGDKVLEEVRNLMYDVTITDLRGNAIFYYTYITDL